MKNVLKDIQNGTFAKGFIADNQAGFPEFKNAGTKRESSNRKSWVRIKKNDAFCYERLRRNSDCWYLSIK